MSEMIRRAIAEHNLTGRTLEGMAYRFEHPSRVKDPGRPPYLEAFHRASANKTIKDHPTFPLAYFHGLTDGTVGSRSRWAGETFGPVVFRAGSAGLEFTATLSKTAGADDMLELIQDGAVGDVSIGAYPVRTVQRAGVVWRDEIRILELSLAPVGTGQHEGAKVLAMRAEDDDPERMTLEQIRRRRLMLATY